MNDGTLFEPDVGSPGADEGAPPTLTVAELAGHISRVTADAFPEDLWVAGQIRNLSRSANGHVYFNLAEPTEAGAQPSAQVSVTLLAPEKRHVNEQLKRAGGAVRMDDGIEVRIRGRLRWWAPRGVLQLRMHGIDPEFTIGRLQADRERILAALSADGLLDANGTRPLPLVPIRIGLVTSLGSAAHADVLAELEASGIGFTIRQVDARTQGAGSGPSVVRALRRLAADDVDLVLLVRGGGARTDLAAFDTDAIARAIAAMPVPVLTGIGHEIDRSIADEVAHTAHKTPTAAAAAVVDRVRAYVERLEATWTEARRAAGASASAADRGLDARAARVQSSAGRVLDRADASLVRTGDRTLRAARRELDRADDVVAAGTLALAVRARRAVDRTDRALDQRAARVGAHDPARLLRRGWTITTTDDGRPVAGVRDLTAGTHLRTRFADGTVTSTIAEIQPASEEPTP